jgi:hypothetical protein
MSRRQPSRGEDIVCVVAVIILVAASIWTWTAAPCGAWRFSKVGDLPARCITHK